MRSRDPEVPRRVLLGRGASQKRKHLNREDLGTILGQTVRFPTSRRGELTDRQIPSHTYLAKVKSGRNPARRQWPPP